MFYSFLSNARHSMKTLYLGNLHQSYIEHSQIFALYQLLKMLLGYHSITVFYSTNSRHSVWHACNLKTQIIALHKESEFCNNEELLSKMLRDHSVCRITDTVVQKRTLVEKDLTLNKAVSLHSSIRGNNREGLKTFSHLLMTVKNLMNSLVELFQGVRASQRKLSTREILFVFAVEANIQLATQFISEECYSCRK